MRPSVPAAAASGLAWALCTAAFVASGAAADATPADWLAAAAVVGLGGPMIGVGVYGISRWVYRRRAAVRFAWAVVTVYLASVAFFVLARAASDRSLAAFGESVEMATAGVLWLVLFPPLWVVHVLAYANHEWMRALDKRG